MSLREELQNRADQLDAELLALSGRIRAIERESDDVHTCINALDIAEMDAQDAALEPAPEYDPSSLAHEEELAPALADPPSAELRSDPGSEENAGTNSEEDISVYGTDVAFAEGVEARLQNIPIDCNPGEGVDATAWDAGWTEAGTTITLHEQSDAELLAELDAPVSIVDDPELQAAVSRAEATLAAAEPAYVGLQDAQLDADWDAMKERETADRKLHFSIFGKREEV